MNTLALFFIACVSLITAEPNETDFQHEIENLKQIQDRTGLNIDNMYLIDFPVYHVKEEDIRVSFEDGFIKMKVYSNGALMSTEVFKAPQNTIDPYWTYKDGTVTVHLPVFKNEGLEIPETVEKETKEDSTVQY
ncbi:unnamed protein product [Colias eurytheme]|nr:unnamed protein product [Colias eurytheme]